MNHAQLVEIARAWLRRVARCKVVIAEMVTKAGEQPDAIGFTHFGESILIECKTSRADFFADRKKTCRVEPSAGMGAFRYFLTMKGMLRAEDVPAGWGLLEIGARGVMLTVRSHATECYGSHRSSDVVSCNAAFSDRSHMRESMLLLSLIRRLAGPGVRGRATVDIDPYTNDEHGNPVAEGDATLATGSCLPDGR